MQYCAAVIERSGVSVGGACNTAWPVYRYNPLYVCIRSAVGVCLELVSLWIEAAGIQLGTVAFCKCKGGECASATSHHRLEKAACGSHEADRRSSVS